MKTTKNCCPYCDSKDITIDVDVTVGTRFENGMLNNEQTKACCSYEEACSDCPPIIVLMMEIVRLKN